MKRREIATTDNAFLSLPTFHRLIILASTGFPLRRESVLGLTDRTVVGPGGARGIELGNASPDPRDQLTS